MNESKQQIFEARDTIALSGRLAATVAGVRSGVLESARFDSMAKAEPKTALGRKRSELFAKAADAARQTESTIAGFLAIEAREKERTAAADRAVTMAKAKAATSKPATLTREQANAAYSKITDPGARDRFRAEHGKTLGL